MRKKQFIEEMGMEESPIQVDIEYALGLYNNNVEPFLELLTNYRSSDKFLDEDTIRLVLGVPKRLWVRMKKMPTLRKYLDLDKDLMAMKSKRDIVRGVSLAPDNGKLLELQAKRFDSFYHDEGKPQGSDIKVSFSFDDASMSDKEIIEKTGIKEEDVKQMEKVLLNGSVIAYEKDRRKLNKHMIDEVMTDIVVTDGGKRREMTFANGDILTIETIYKEYGTKGGDICSLCKQGELKEYGGCATCENCGAQLKCGL